MNNRHKIFVLMFVGLLSFMGFKGWVFIKTQYLPATANVNTDKERIVMDSDFDNDGLSDIEESFYGTDFENPDTDGDGYLDGEELASGYNPNLSAPNDVRPGRVNRESASVNLTERLVGRLSASIEEGELGDNVDDLSFLLEDIAYNTTLETLPIFYSEALTESDIIILYTDDLASFQEYIDKTFKVLNDHVLSVYIGQVQSLESMLENFDESGDDFFEQAQLYIQETQTAINKLTAIRVPKNLVSEHLLVINTLKELDAAYKSLEASDGDILKAAVTSQKIVEINTRFDNIFIGLMQLVDAEGIIMPNLSMITLYNSIIQR